MLDNETFAKISDIVKLYVEGMCQNDAGKLRAAMHEKACVIGHYDGGLEWDTRDAFVAAVAAEKGFADLRAPVKRVTLPDSPAPVSKPLEDAFHPSPRSIAQACLDVLRADVQVTTHARDVQETFAGPY